ncbi:MAG: M28 family peptidase [bacterium]|nr:M28 family peptidase [bacterium]
MRGRVRVFLFLLLCVPQASLAYDSCDAILSEADIRSTVDILAHPALAGRGTGQRGFYVAGLFLARELRNAGFMPLPNNTEGYFQTFRAYTGAKAGGEISRNVIGYLPGKVSGEYVIIGAHYDHLGEEMGTTYLGADDNASGTSGVLAIARQLGACVGSGKKLRRSVIVGFWGAEEMGLVGSEYFVASNIVPLKEIVTVFNLDMVGRNNPRQLTAIGAERPIDFPRANPILEKLLQEENAKLVLPFAIGYEDGGVGYFNRTDSYSFFDASSPKNRLPVLTLTSLLHKDYHRPTDTPEKIDAGKVRNVAQLLYQIVVRLATSALRPAYTTQTH